MHTAHLKDRSNLVRFELSARYQCNRVKKGHGPIKVRIICNFSSETRKHVCTSLDNDDGVRESTTLQCIPTNAVVSTGLRKRSLVGSSANALEKNMREQVIIAKLDGAKKSWRSNMVKVNELER
jgi:hypothetical protein